MKIGLVPGYGVEMTAEVKEYLREVAEIVKKEKLDGVILSGGFTRTATNPMISEANAMENYLFARLGGHHLILSDEDLGPWDAAYALEDGRTLFLKLDEDAYTTLDNMLNAAHFLHTNQLLAAGNTLLIFCNAQKEWVLKRLAKHFFPHTYTETYPVQWKLGVAWIAQALVNVFTLYAMRKSWAAGWYRNRRIKYFSTQ